MADTIKIYNPKDIPFGQLSNNYRHQMKIDGKNWFYVTSYIYANMLKNDMYKEKVHDAPIKDVQKLYQALESQELKDSISKAIREALQVKFENTELKELLIQTGNRPIFFASYDNFLGTGMSNNGENYYGKLLMQARHNIITANQAEKRKIAQQERDKLIIDIYLAEIGLVAKILSGNNLEEYFNLTPTQIVDQIGREMLTKKLPPNIDLRKPYITKYLDNPENLVPQIRKDYIDRYRLIKIKERNNIVFDMYADYLLEKQYPELDRDKYEDAKKEQFFGKNLEALQQKLYNLYLDDMLSEKLSKAIDIKLSDFNVPNEELVKQIRSEVIVYTNKPLINEIPYVEPSGEPIIVYPEIFDNMEIKFVEYVKFAPDTFVNLLNINNLLYPNVYLYLINYLLSRLDNVGSLQNGYELLINTIVENTEPNNFSTSTQANNIYDKKYNKNYFEQISKNAKKALDEKFKDRELQDILLITGDADLVWDDFNEPILGSGKQPNGQNGQNVVGMYLMELRQKISNERENETVDVLTTEQITNFLNKDTFMKRWLEMRVGDMCKINIIMKDYLWKKEQTDTKLDTTVVQNVLDKIYQPCSHIYATSNKVTAEAPPYFRSMVRKCNGFNQVSPETIQLMWSRIAVMIYYLMEHMQTSSIKNIKTALAQLELMVSEPANCEKIIPKNEFENCIASAILNILVGIKNFNNMTEITELEIDTAISIILGKDITKTKQKTPITKLDPQQQKIEAIAKELVPEDSEQDSDQDLDEELRKELELELKDKPLKPPSARGKQQTKPPYVELTRVPRIPQIYDEDEDDIFSQESNSESKEPSIFDNISDGELSDSEDGFSPPKNILKQKLLELGLASEPNIGNIIRKIEQAIQSIDIRKMSKKVKQNRVNFFATQR